MSTFFEFLVDCPRCRDLVCIRLAQSVRHGNGATLTLEERVLEALAAEQLQPAKPMSAYQLFHMHRVAELKEVTPGGIKHRNAFKRAAHDWTAMPKERLISTFSVHR